MQRWNWLKKLLEHPSTANWQRLCILLDRWPLREQRERALEEAEAGLLRWPEKLRTTPPDWLLHWAQHNEAPPGWSLVRNLHIPQTEGWLLTELQPHGSQQNALTLLFQQADLSRISQIHFQGAWLRAASLRGLSERKSLQQNLVSLCLEENELGRQEAFSFAFFLRFRHLVELRLSQACLGDCAARFAELVGGPLFPRLVRLDLSENALGDQALRLLATSPFFPSLTHLHWRSNLLRAEGLAALARSKHFPRLRHLELGSPQRPKRESPPPSSSDSPTAHSQPGTTPPPAPASMDKTNIAGPQGAEALAGAPWLPQLHYLDLENNQIGDEGLQALLSPQHRCVLRTLNLAGNNLSDGAIRVLASSSSFPTLESLFLQANPFGRGGMRAIATSDLGASLRHFSLGSQSNTSEALDELSRGPQRWQLTSLSLEDQQTISPQALTNFSRSENFPHLKKIELLVRNPHYDLSSGLRSLMRSPQFPELEEWHLPGAAMGDRALQSLAQSQSFPRLSHLNLEGNKLSDEALAALTQSSFFPRLTHLCLDHNHLRGGKALATLARSPHFPHLSLLSLKGCHLSGGLAELAQSPHFPRLSELHLEDNLFQDAQVIALARSPHFPLLHTLTLALNQCRDESALILAQSPLLGQLALFTFESNPVSHRGNAAMVLSPHIGAYLRYQFLRRLSLVALRQLGERLQLPESIHLPRQTLLPLLHHNLSRRAAALRQQEK